jgi:transcriptional regulator with XRE-family HTH domain
MSKSASALNSITHKMLAAGEVSGAKPLRKPLAVDLGSAIERAIELAKMTKQEVAYRMGYGSNQASLSRWISGAEMPQLAKLWAIEELQGPLVIALAEAVNDSAVVVTTHIEVRQRKVG